MANTIDLVRCAARAIYGKKGLNIFGIDLRGISSMTDYVLIAEGSVDRHIQALSEAIVEELRAVGHTPLHIEGDREGGWIVLDYLDFIVHLFTPELREKYALERLWPKGKILDVQPSQIQLG